eukprot:TRINITY_DN36232_c0_g1_i4.p1 TRINITY_DN36232_c0_g1~~TRINITY_DN36232_c0_g1_i4.p1  ORF type:complete len:126 (+),score=8.96 TRINITY_DN36232_c0_g1_i4:228-605(+)
MDTARIQCQSREFKSKEPSAARAYGSAHKLTLKSDNVGNGTLNNSVHNEINRKQLSSAYPKLDTHSRLHDTIMSMSTHSEISANRGHRGWHRPGHTSADPPSPTNYYDPRFRDANKHDSDYPLKF